MNTAARQPLQQEIELKLALPGRPAELAAALAATPLLRRRRMQRERLVTVYYDTPDQALRRARVALRLRRAGSEARPVWVQTLKTAGHSDSALTQRGEWETEVAGPALDRDALQATPWPALDPDGALFAALAPCFETDFERSRWLVRERGGSVVEVALDLGQVVAGGRRAPLCELEFELQAGEAAALFDIAQRVTRTVAVLPLAASKAERGYALAQDALDRPQHARPVALHKDQGLTAAAQRVLVEMFGQFCANLAALARSDDPEVVHQARVGWRRLRSALRLFRPVLSALAPPPWEALRPLLGALGDCRDLDVARAETLPPLAAAYMAGDAARASAWQSLMAALLQASANERDKARRALAEPAVGATLLALTQWLEGLLPALLAREASTQQAAGAVPSLRSWARRRMLRLARQLRHALEAGGGAENQHRVRILAKRLRYGAETLQALLPRHRAARWHDEALRLQTELGSARDLLQVGALAARLRADPELVGFLRGVAAGAAPDLRRPWAGRS